MCSTCLESGASGEDLATSVGSRRLLVGEDGFAKKGLQDAPKLSSGSLEAVFGARAVVCEHTGKDFACG